MCPGHLYIAKFDDSKRSQGKCILTGGKWFTPPEFESKKAKKWKQSLLHLGKPLHEFNLSFLSHQDSESHLTSASESHAASAGSLLVVDTPVLVTPPSPSCNVVDVGIDCMSIVDPVLSFIKAFRLRGDVDSLKRIIVDHFSSSSVEAAKRSLWGSCYYLLDKLGLPHVTQRDSDKRSQLLANLDDILTAFKVLDSKDMIPLIYCEASELYKLPPISLDPVAEQVQSNSKSLNSLVAAVHSLENKLSTLLIPSQVASNGSNVVGDRLTNFARDSDTNTYASRVSSFITTSPNPTSVSPLRLKRSGNPINTEDRESNLILFGLPESQSILDSKKTVDELLQFLAEKPVSIKDLFRLGKRTQSTSSTNATYPRPILIKLSETWDRKVIHLHKRNLQHFRIKKLFIRADVPPDHRLRQKRVKPPHTHESSGYASTSLIPSVNSNNQPTLHQAPVNPINQSPIAHVPIQRSKSVTGQSSACTNLSPSNLHTCFLSF